MKWNGLPLKSTEFSILAPSTPHHTNITRYHNKNRKVYEIDQPVDHDRLIVKNSTSPFIDGI
jgi:hypothetical protein